MVFAGPSSPLGVMRCIFAPCVPTHMYLAYKIAHNAGIIMPGKCTSARALEFVPKISYLYLFVRIREGSNGQSMAKGTARFVMLYVCSALHVLYNVQNETEIISLQKNRFLIHNF